MVFSNRDALRLKSGKIKNQDPEQVQLKAPSTYLRPELTWTHYRMLMRVDNEQARNWYMNEAAEQRWSTRQLERQITTFYYERLLSSRDKVSRQQEENQDLTKIHPEYFIRDPYVLEFLDIKDRAFFRESDLESALIDNLQHFLLELGKGFSFVARQKHIRLDDDQFYIDLVFYNFYLKCFGSTEGAFASIKMCERYSTLSSPVLCDVIFTLSFDYIGFIFLRNRIPFNQFTSSCRLN